jgi:hypothetical protein
MRRGASAGHWRGSKKGVRACGRASWPRNPATCASAHAPVHGEREEGGTDKTGPRRRERKEDARGNGSALANRAHETDTHRERERESERAKETGADGSAPLGSERAKGGHARGRTAADWRGSACQAARARGLAGLSGSTGLLCVFLFLWIF